MFHVYILVCSDGSFYVGHTNDLSQRLAAHNAGTAAQHTRDHRPVRIAYSEPHPTRIAAMQRERQIKGWTRSKKEALIEGDVDRLHSLARSGQRS